MCICKIFITVIVREVNFPDGDEYPSPSPTEGLDGFGLAVQAMKNEKLDRSSG